MSTFSNSHRTWMKTFFLHCMKVIYLYDIYVWQTHRYHCFKYGNIPTTESGQIYLNCVTVVWSPWTQLAQKWGIVRAKVYHVGMSLLTPTTVLGMSGFHFHCNCLEMWCKNRSAAGTPHVENQLGVPLPLSSLHDINIFMCMFVHMCWCMYMFLCKYRWIYIYIYTININSCRKWTNVYVYMCACTHKMDMHMNVYVQTHTYIYI